MNIDKLKQLLRDGEGMTAEFKRCERELPRSIYETVCSFSNRYGGYILLGVEDNGAVSGVPLVLLVLLAVLVVRLTLQKV